MGRFWETDLKGVILNDACLDKIASIHNPAIEKTVAAYRSHIGTRLHSVYIRGTVPRGMAVPGVSDLDSLALVTGWDGQGRLPWAVSEEAKIVTVCPQLTGVQFEVYSLQEDVKRNRVSELCFVLKTQAVCVYGEDVTATLPDYRPDHTVANIDIVQIEADIDEVLDQIRRQPADGNVSRYWCKRIMKNLIRACFALTIVKEQRFTRDLGLCAECFLAYYPQQRRNVEKALHFVLYPTKDSEELIQYLTEFGGWVIARANEWLDVHNPGRCLEMELSKDQYCLQG